MGGQILIDDVAACLQGFAMKLLAFYVNRVHKVCVKKLDAVLLPIKFHAKQIESGVHHLELGLVVFEPN